MGDFLLECNDQRIPETDFVRQFCVRCQNRDCVRAALKGQRFEQRVKTWEDRLFLQVPRLDPSDPRYDRLANQEFPQVGPGWGDAPEIRGADDSAGHAPTPPVQPAVVMATAPSHYQGLNTPATAGLMLTGAPKAPAPKVDPWAGPQAPAPAAETVIRPGARIKMSGSPSK